MKRFSILLLGSLVMLSGCSSVKESLGMERTTPDEFAVVERAPLTVPPNFDLVAPEPGAPRPQDSAEVSAKGLVLGSQSSAQKAISGSRAENALLSKAGATQAAVAAPEAAPIRKELAKPDEPVKPKTVAEKLGMKGDTPRGKALDPVIEAKRLDQIKVNSTPIEEQPVDKNAK